MSTESRRPCPVCGEMILQAAKVCRFCGEEFSSRSADDEGDSTGGVIPYKNVPALFAYYLGVFSIIPCFPVGIAAVILGIKGLKVAREKPQVRGQVHAWIGIVAGGCFGLLWLAFTVLMAVGIIAGANARR
jgi:hypothetical protein